MRKILFLAWKDTVIRFSSWTEWLFFLILPVIFTVFIGGGLGGADETADDRLLLLVVDGDGSEAASAFLATLEATGVVRPETRPADEAAARFADEEAPALLTIPPGFGQRLQTGAPVSLNLETQADDGRAAAVVRAVEQAAAQTGEAAAIARASLQAIQAQDQLTEATAADAYLIQAQTAARQRLAGRPVRVVATQSALATTTAARFDQASFVAAGQLLTWVFIPLLGTAGIFAYERILGTLRRLVTTPTRGLTFLLGTIGGQLSLALLQMTILILLGRYAFGINWGHSALGLALMVLTFGLAAVAMGAALGTLVRSEGQANGLSIMLGMSLAMLGGAWFPLETFPTTVQRLVHVLPTTWAMRGFTDIVIRGLGVADIAPEAGVLLLFAAVFLGLGVWRFRYE